LNGDIGCIYDKKLISFYYLKTNLNRGVMRKLLSQHTLQKYSTFFRK
jgi:hypothetical protein